MPEPCPAVQKWPGGHGIWDVFVDGVGQKKPAKQGKEVDVVEPRPRQFPAAHDPKQAAAREACPKALPKVPAGHSKHAVAPVVFEKEPAGQGAQMAPRP